MTRSEGFSVACLLGISLVGQACLRLETPPTSLANGETCETSSECAPGSICEYDSTVFDYVCRVEGGCTSHSQCLASEACAFGACGPAECVDAGSCGAYACNTGVRQCFDSCRIDGECGTGYVCRDGECLSATCTAATAARVCQGAVCNGGVCESAYYCDVYGCADGYTCESYQCVRNCSSDAQCERYVCDIAFGECREGCSLAGDCQAGYECKDNFCQTVSP